MPLLSAATIVELLAYAQPWGGFAPAPGYDYLAPNVRRFQSARSSLRSGFRYLHLAIGCSLAAFAIDVVIGLAAITMTEAPLRGEAAGASLLIGGVSFVLQGVAIAAGFDGESTVTSPDQEAFPDLANRETQAWYWFAFAAAAFAVGAVAGFAFSFPEGLARFHAGPSFGPYAPHPKILLNAAVWSATGGVVSVLVALGIKEMLAPYLGPSGASRWPLFLGLVVTASAVSSALSFYGLFFLGGNNPAGLGGAISAASMAVLWVQVKEARASVESRREPEPVWLMLPAFSPPGIYGGPPPFAPAAPAAQVGIPPGPATLAAPAAWPGGPLPAARVAGFPAPPPPAASPIGAARFCPQCGSPNVLVAYPPVRQVHCLQCGRDSAY